MTSNVAVKITADVVDLQAKYALAKAENNALSASLNKLARDAVAAGGEMSTEMKTALTKMAEASAKAKTEMNDLGSQLKKTHEEGSRFEGVMDLVKEGLGALGLAFSVEKIVEFGKQIEENAAHLEHEAQVLQLSVTAYQAYRQAAVDSGVGVDVADQAIQRFSKNVSEAAVGTGPAAKALLEMGISANQSKEAILQQASAFLEHASATERDRYATELFGRSGAQMMPLFERWAEGADNLAAKYDSLGRMLSPGVTKKAEEAEIALSGSMERLKTGGTPAVVDATEKLAGFVDWLARANDWTDRFVKKFDIAIPKDSWLSHLPGARQATEAEFTEKTGANSAKPYRVPTSESAKPYVIPKEMSEKDEVASLSALDSKLRERADLEKEIAIAKKTQKDASAAGDTKGAATAGTVVADLQKQLDSLNKVPFGGGFKDAGAKAIAEAKEAISEINANQTIGDVERKAEIQKTYQDLLNSGKLNAAQHLEMQTAMNKDLAAEDKRAAAEKRQIDQSNAQTAVSLAKIGLAEKKQVLEEEVAAGTITKQQELAALIDLTQQEGQLQIDALTKAQQGYAADSVFFQQKENEKKVVARQTEEEIAAIRRQIQQTQNKEELQGQMSVLRELSSASNTFWGQIFSGRVGVLGAMQAAGINFLQKELEQDSEYFIARMLLSKAALASDQTLAQGGVLLHALTEGEKTAATAGGTAARTGIQTSGAAVENASFLVRAARWIASELGMTAATEASEATKTATKTAALATTKTEEATMNTASAESYAGVAAAAAASAVAGIPIIGPELAIGAAATTFAAMQPYVALAALATGAYSIPTDGPAYLHEGEMVVPKTFATSLRENISRGGGAANIFGGTTNSSATNIGGDHFDITQHFHGADKNSARDMVDEINYQRRIGRLKIPTRR